MSITINVYHLTTKLTPDEGFVVNMAVLDGDVLRLCGTGQGEDEQTAYTRAFNQARKRLNVSAGEMNMTQAGDGAVWSLSPIYFGEGAEPDEY